MGLHKFLLCSSTADCCSELHCNMSKALLASQSRVKDLADDTEKEFKAVREEVSKDFKAVREDIKALRTEIAEQIAGLRTEVAEQIAEQTAVLRTEIAEQIAEQTAVLRTEIAGLADVMQNIDDQQARVIDAALGCVLEIRGPSQYGTGFFVSPDGFVLTARHVTHSSAGVDTGNGCAVTGTGASLFWELVADFPDWDLSLLKVPAVSSGRNVAYLTPCDDFHAMMSVGIVGFGLEREQYGVQPLATWGKVSSRLQIRNSAGETEEAPFQLCTPNINKGMSGGPVLTRTPGRFIGVFARMERNFGEDQGVAGFVVTTRASSAWTLVVEAMEKHRAMSLVSGESKYESMPARK